MKVRQYTPVTKLKHHKEKSIFHLFKICFIPKAIKRCSVSSARVVTMTLRQAQGDNQFDRVRNNAIILTGFGVVVIMSLAKGYCKKSSKFHRHQKKEIL